MDTINDGDIEVTADFAQASSPLRWRSLDDVRLGDDNWRSTVFQVADARHDPERALTLVSEWLGQQS